MDPPFCYVLSNCMSVTNFRVGIHLQLFVVSLLVHSALVFVFKDIVFFSQKFHEVVLFAAAHYRKKPERGLVI